MSGKGTPFGAFLDSTLDRMEEGIVLTAVGAYFASAGDQLTPSPAAVAAVLASLMVSYTRARAEALGVECKVGIATRAVRVAILCDRARCSPRGAGLGDFELLEPAVYVLAVLTTFTTFCSESSTSANRLRIILRRNRPCNRERITRAQDSPF